MQSPSGDRTKCIAVREPQKVGRRGLRGEPSARCSDVRRRARCPHARHAVPSVRSTCTSSTSSARCDLLALAFLAAGGTYSRAAAGDRAAADPLALAVAPCCSAAEAIAWRCCSERWGCFDRPRACVAASSRGAVAALRRRPPAGGSRGRWRCWRSGAAVATNTGRVAARVHAVGARRWRAAATAAVSWDSLDYHLLLAGTGCAIKTSRLSSDLSRSILRLAPANGSLWLVVDGAPHSELWVNLASLVPWRCFVSRAARLRASWGDAPLAARRLVVGLLPTVVRFAPRLRRPGSRATCSAACSSGCAGCAAGWGAVLSSAPGSASPAAQGDAASSTRGGGGAIALMARASGGGACSSSASPLR